MLEAADQAGTLRRRSRPKWAAGIGEAGRRSTATGDVEGLRPRSAGGNRWPLSESRTLTEAHAPSQSSRRQGARVERGWRGQAWSACSESFLLTRSMGELTGSASTKCTEGTVTLDPRPGVITGRRALAGLRRTRPATSRTSTTTSSRSSRPRKAKKNDRLGARDPQGGARHRHRVAPISRQRSSRSRTSGGPTCSTRAALDQCVYLDEPEKRAVGFKLSEGMEIPRSLRSFKFARQKSKLAGTIRGSILDQGRLLTPAGTPVDGIGSTA